MEIVLGNLTPSRDGHPVHLAWWALTSEFLTIVRHEQHKFKMSGGSADAFLGSSEVPDGLESP